jgi:hypothetical protein
MKWTVAILLVCLLFSGALPLFSGVDLVAMKKKEDERRKKIAKSRIVVTDANVNLISTGNKKYGFVQMESDEPPLEEGEAAAPAAARSEAQKTKQPGYWKDQQTELEGRISLLKEEIEAGQSQLNKLWSDFYIRNIPAEQQAIREQIANLTAQIEQKKLFLSEAESQLEDFFEKARKAGVPPGWLR